MTQTPDVLIVGGGIIGLAIALEVRSRGATVTVLTRDRQEAATRAAAGMLAPHAEGIPPGALLDLGLKSLSLYPNWIRTIEDQSGRSTSYWPCGILAPVYASPSSSSSSPSLSSPTPSAQWFDQSTIHAVQPDLSAEVIGGWWHPDDGQVDNRELHDALWAAAEAMGVILKSGIQVDAIQQAHGRVAAIQTASEVWTADHYVLATGAWTPDLLPVPIQPVKGQMLAVRLPTQVSALMPLKRVLYGEQIYIIPRQDGRIIIGATVETVGFTPHNTPAGLQSLLREAIRLYPPIGNLPIEECWWGFRPGSPDQWPILGASSCENLTLATGHHRNGILLAPATALLIADWISSRASSDLLSAFSWERFGGRSPHPSHPSAPESWRSPSSAIFATSPSSERSPDSIEAISAESLSDSMHILESSTSPSAEPSFPSGPSAPSREQTSGEHDSPLVIAGRTFHSRLMTGTGKYRTFDQMQQSVAASGCEIVTVAVRRVQTKAPGHEGLAEALDWRHLWMLPNTAGCKTAEDAIRVARLGREMAKLLGQEDNNFVKLEVIPDATYLLPDPIGTLEAAEKLVKEGFAVLPYINADPLLAKRLEEVGCATVMPLGSPIGSGQGIRNAANIQIILENAKVPVVVDAGIGTPSEAAQAMEMGADALLINTAIAQATAPARMGRAMKLATEAGRLAYLSGRIPIKTSASASSPVAGTITA